MLYRPGIGAGVRNRLGNLGSRLRGHRAAEAYAGQDAGATVRQRRVLKKTRSPRQSQAVMPAPLTTHPIAGEQSGRAQASSSPESPIRHVAGGDRNTNAAIRPAPPPRPARSPLRPLTGKRAADYSRQDRKSAGILQISERDTKVSPNWTFCRSLSKAWQEGS